MKIRQLLTVLVISTAITACAAPKVKMKDDVRHSFKTVAIDHSIEVPSTIKVGSATQNVADNFGLIGMLISDGDKADRGAAVEAAMKQQGVDIADIVYKKMAREMAQRTPYKPLKRDSASDATMSIKVHYLGLDVAGAGSHLYPQIGVSAKMKNASGKTIWANHTMVGPLQKKNKAKYTYKELIAQPARLKEIMTTAAGLAAKRVMADL